MACAYSPGQHRQRSGARPLARVRHAAGQSGTAYLSVLAIGVPVFVLAGAVKGLIGIGLPTLAIGLMAQFIGAREAISLVIVPMLFANGWQVMRSDSPRASVLRVTSEYRVLLLSLFMTIGAVALLAPSVSVATVTLTLGIVMTLFAILSLWRDPARLSDRFDRLGQGAAGVVGGIIGGISGIWAPPIIIYLSARRIDKQAFVETVGVLLFGSTAVLMVGYLASGVLAPLKALQSLAFIPPALAGFAIGERFRTRVSGAGFRTLVMSFFLLMGLNLIRRALWGQA